MADILKDIKESINTIGREIEDNFLKTQMEHVKKKTKSDWIKNTLHEINRLAIKTKK